MFEKSKTRYAQIRATQPAKKRTVKIFSSENGKKYANGLMLNLLTGATFMGLGILLTLTLIGSIIGIPLIIVGLFLMIFSPFGATLIDKQECPYCHNMISCFRGQKSLKCKNCKKQLVIKAGGKALEIVV